MGFRKTATIEPLGYFNKTEKVASKKLASFYLEASVHVDIEAALEVVASTYNISRDPNDYLLIPARANSADRPNENLDGWEHEELVRFDPRVGSRVYSTYELKPHYVNHNASNPRLSRGVLLDAHYNDSNPATDQVKEAVYAARGTEPDTDNFVEVLIAFDQTKDPSLARAYKDGSVYRFSMGCDVESTKCSACGNVASTTLQFCNHIKGKHARQPVRLEGGRMHTPLEWCQGTIFAELSAVDDPADKAAEVQEGLLNIVDAGNSIRLSASEIEEISSFVARYAREIPDSLAGVLTKDLSR